MASVLIPQGIPAQQVDLSERTLHISGGRMFHNLSDDEAAKLIAAVPRARLVTPQRSPLRDSSRREQKAEETRGAPEQDRKQPRAPRPNRK